MAEQARFAGQVAVVTGAGSGLGAASARRLAADGAQVLLVDIDADAVKRVADEIGDSAAWTRADVADEDQVDAYMGAALDAFGRVDLYHLNAGIFGSFAPLPELPIDEFDRVMAVNLRGMVLGLRAAFRQYAAQSSRGSVVLTASIASLRGSADLLPYQISKHGTLGALRGAAMYGGPLGIRVNAVAPGIVPTGLFTAASEHVGGGNDMVRRASTTPLRRAGTPEEIASVVAFLLSDDAAYMTGEVVSVDGGAQMVNTVRPSGGAGAWDFAAIDRATYGSP